MPRFNDILKYMDNLAIRKTEIESRLTKELSTIRTGRANPSLLDSVMVDSYGTMTPINQVGSIISEDARTLKISPWDQSQAKSIEEAINKAELGLSVNVSDGGIRAIVPELTGEQREKYVKIAKDKLEDARIQVKKAREDAIKEYEKQKTDGEISEDDFFSYKKDIQEEVDKLNSSLEKIFEAKAIEVRG